MDRQTAKQHAEVGARYVQYCKRADPDPNAKGWDDFHAAMAMAASYLFLDLRDLTPDHLIEPMLAQFREWQASGLVADTLSAQDRLNGLYGICGNCGEFAPKEIGGLPVQSGMRYAETGEHVCLGCREDMKANQMISSALKEVAYHA